MIKRAEGFGEVCLAELHIYHGVDLLGVSLEPCGLGLHHIVGCGHAFAESEVGGAEVLVGFGEVCLGHVVGLVCLFGLIRGLAHLQRHQLAGVFELELADNLVALGGPVFIVVAAPVPQRYRYYSAY